MCGLNQVFCTLLDKVGLLNGPGNHHEFVMLQSPDFPAASMRHLVESGVTTAGEYRLLATSERIRAYFSGVMNRPEDKDYIEGKTDALPPDPWVSPELWSQRVVPLIRGRRADRILRLSRNGDPAMLAELDHHPDAETVAARYYRGNYSLRDGEKAFVFGDSLSLEAGHGAVSTAYVRSLLVWRMNNLQTGVTSARVSFPADVGLIGGILENGMWQKAAEIFAAHHDFCLKHPRRKQRKDRYKAIVAVHVHNVVKDIQQHREKIVEALLPHVQRVSPAKPQELPLAA